MVPAQDPRLTATKFNDNNLVDLDPGFKRAGWAWFRRQTQ